MFGKLENDDFLADVHPLLAADEAEKFDEDAARAAFSRQSLGAHRRDGEEVRTAGIVGRTLTLTRCVGFKRGSATAHHPTDRRLLEPLFGSVTFNPFLSSTSRPFATSKAIFANIGAPHLRDSSMRWKSIQPTNRNLSRFLRKPTTKSQLIRP
jgi:hypothetical protein